MPKNRVRAIPLSTFDSADLDGTFQAINPAGLPAACFLIRVINESNQEVTISYDGDDEHDVVPSQDLLLLEAQTNSEPNSYLANFAKGTRVYVTGTAGEGNIYLAGYYLEKT